MHEINGGDALQMGLLSKMGLQNPMNMRSIEINLIITFSYLGSITICSLSINILLGKTLILQNNSLELNRRTHHVHALRTALFIYSFIKGMLICLHGGLGGKDIGQWVNDIK